MEKISFRTMRSSDFAFAIRLTDTMQWDLTEKDFRFMMTLEPEGSFVALDGPTRIGVITTVRFGEIGWIGNVMMKPSHRSKGVGAKLVKHAMRYLAEKGVAAIGLYSYENTVQFYEKLGFKPDLSFVRFVGHGSTAHFNARLVEKMTKGDLQAAIDFDNSCMGWNRERLLKRVFRASKDLCYVARESSALVGFVMADWYRQEIGPLVCQPNREEDALNLINAELSKLADTEVRIGVSESKRKIADALRNMDFREEFKVVRMYWGKKLKGLNCLLAMESLERG